MKKINKQFFQVKIKNIIIDGNIPEISQESINEFKIGKNYFYEIKENQNLVDIQKWLNDYLQEKIPLNNAAVAFRKNCSYLHLFEPHIKNYHFLRLDIRSFFHSINVDHIKNVFKEYFENDFIDHNKNQTLLDAFINIITYKIPLESNNEKFRNKQVLPMGFITSPVISNIIFRKLDILIQKICFERNIIYTRYADDMLFSSDKTNSYIHSENFENEINILLSQMNFKLNKNKTLKAKNTISLNGYTIQYSKFSKFIMQVNEKLINEVRLSNKKIDIIRKIIYMIENKTPPQYILKKLFNYELSTRIPHDKAKKYYQDQLINKLTGYRSYLLSIMIFHGKYQCCQQNTIAKYKKILNDLNILIQKG
jgi:RNA-directed DNA polymerase